VPSLVATLWVFRLKLAKNVRTYVSFQDLPPFKLRLLPSISVTVHWSLIIQQFDAISATRRW